MLDVKQNLIQISSAKFGKTLSWFIMLAAYAYLFYILYNYNQYADLFQHISTASASKYMWLALVFALLPLNLLIESIKWRSIVANSQQLKITEAIKAVLAGFSSGFFTPNRTGEFAGRLLFMHKAHRKTAVIYSIINGITQNIIIVICGLPAAILFFTLKSQVIAPNIKLYFAGIALLLLGLILLYFALPLLAKSKLWQRYLGFASEIKLFTGFSLLKILFYSLCRYAVFSFQFFAMLQFFGVELELWQALLTIPANYLFVTITPSLAFSEAAVRSSFAVFFISTFTPQLAGIAFASIALWLVNFGFPMLAGGVVLVKRKD